MRKRRPFREEARVALAFERILRKPQSRPGYVSTCPHLCQGLEEWGYLCCLDCGKLYRCLKEWRKSQEENGGWVEDPVCSYLSTRNKKTTMKWCDTLLRIWRKYKEEQE